MTKAEQITIDKNKVYSNVQIFSTQEANSKGIPNYFEDAQTVIQCNEGILVLPHYAISVIRLNSSKKKFGTDLSKLVKRVCLVGDLVYSQCYLINPQKHLTAGIPEIFRPYEQFTFACPDGLFITTDCHVVMIQW
jgi:hypothetical protein